MDQKLAAFVHSWLGRTLSAFVVSVLVFTFGSLLRKVFDGLVERISRYVEARSTGHARTTAVLARGVGLRAVLYSARLLRLLASLLLLYVWLVVLAWAFDPTHVLLVRIVEPVEDAAVSILNMAVGFIPNIIILGLLVVVTRLVLEGVGTLGEAVAEGHVTLAWLPAELAGPTRRLVNIGVILTATMLALPYVPGSDSKTVQAFSIVLGVLVSFGSSSVISNLMAGLVLTYSRAFRVGDRVKIGDVVGDVAHLGVFATRIRTIKDEEVVIPNAVVQNGPWTNFARFASDPGVQVHTQVTIGYDVPWRVVHRLLVEAALSTEGIEQEPEPYVLQRALDDFYVRYEVNAFSRRPNDLHFIEGRLCQHIQDTFFRAGVEICSPHYEAFRDGTARAIPADPEQGPAPREPLPGEGPRAHHKSFRPHRA